jgi:hypothetical protein
MNAKSKPLVRAPERTSRNLSTGHRVLHVEVPEDVFNNAKAQALMIGHRWPQFVVELLREVDPQKCGVLSKEAGPLLQQLCNR